jgi:hypothetical protein
VCSTDGFLSAARGGRKRDARAGLHVLIDPLAIPHRIQSDLKTAKMGGL